MLCFCLSSICQKIKDLELHLYSVMSALTPDLNSTVNLPTFISALIQKEGGKKQQLFFQRLKQLSLWESQMKYCGISIDFIFKNGMLNCVPAAWTFRLSKLLPPLISIPFICTWQPGLTGYHSYGMQLLNFYFCCVCFALSCLSSAFPSFSISLRLPPVLLNPVQYLLCGSNRLVEGI